MTLIPTLELFEQQEQGQPAMRAKPKVQVVTGRRQFQSSSGVL